MTEAAESKSTTDTLEPTSYRTHSCGVLRITDVGKHVKLCGWVNSRRDHGGLIFVDLRDRTGRTQVVFSPDRVAEAHLAAESLRSEFVIQVEGEVIPRNDDKKNPKLPTGEVEVTVKTLNILTKAETPPFPIDDDCDVAEDTRLKWRFIDLRRPRMQRMLSVRHGMVRGVREYLSSHGFLEVETPLLGKSTPEGARDYLVPVRLMPGNFYALPQSPQLYKQLLMVGGCDRYFQIARCLRDEDLRADRQPEFTQIDVEMSFATFEDVAEATEGLVCAAFKNALGIDLERPFPRRTYHDCMDKYGSDKPDFRYDIQIHDAGDFARAGEFEVFKRALDEGGIIKVMRGVGWGKLSRKDIDNLTKEVQVLGAGGLGWMKVKTDSLESGISKNFSVEARKKLKDDLGATEDDLIVFVGGPAKTTYAAMAYLRNKLGAEQGWKEPDKFAFSWIVDFPLFTYDANSKKWASEHHPFTSPYPDDLEKLESDPGNVRSYSYDLVLNGFEVASGSVRIHDPEIQKRVFKLLSLSDEEIEAKFGFFCGALGYGAPPHAGIALGVDRIVAMMLDVPSIRDVIAFPKTQRGQDLMMGAPSAIDEKLLREAGIALLEPPEQAK